MRRLYGIAILMGLSLAADAAPSFYGFAGAFIQGPDSGTDIPVPNVVGEADSTAAEMVLNAAGLVLGNVLARCSDAAADEVVGQDPAPGTPVAAMTAVDVLVSNGIECASGRPGVRLRGLSIGL